MESLTVLFDNGGSALLLADRYTHHYTDARQLAADILAAHAGHSARTWDGNQPGYRRLPAPEDSVVGTDDILDVLEGAGGPEYAGAFEEEFWAALVGGAA